MATYAIGDIQGCYDEFRLLLQKIHFDPQKDTLWLAGDIVSRGPKSLEVLQYAYNNQTHCKIVLGNHDLHLLACYYSERKTHPKENLESLLQSKNAVNLLTWLRKQPVAIYHQELDFLMTHAGVPAEWDLKQTLECAKQLELVLFEEDSAIAYFRDMYGNHPERWQPDLQGQDRLRYITNALTRMRFRYPDGCLDFENKCAPLKLTSEWRARIEPWFNQDLLLGAQTRVVFGHWATLEGQLETASNAMKRQLFPLDTGCVWGGRLTALCLDDLQSYSVEALSSPLDEQNPALLAIK